MTEEKKILIDIDLRLFNGKLTKEEAIVAYMNAGYTRERSEAISVSILNDKIKAELGIH